MMLWAAPLRRERGDSHIGSEGGETTKEERGNDFGEAIEKSEVVKVLKVSITRS